MKTLIFVVKDIPKNLRQSASLLLVIILGISVAFSTHLITFGVVMNNAEEKRNYAVYNTVSITGVDTFDRSVLEKVTTMPGVKNAFCFFIPEDAEYILVGWYGNDPNNWFPLGEGSFLNSMSSKKEVYVSTNIAQYDPKNTQTICIHGTEYEVVGSTTLWMLNLTNGLDRSLVSDFLPYSSFVFVELKELLGMNISDACIRIQFDYDGTGSKKEFSVAANELFGYYALTDAESNIILPSDPLQDYMLSNLVFFIAIGLLCLLSYMNIVGMYWYHLSLQKRRFRIYMIVGAKSGQLLSILVWQYVILFSVSFALSFAISVLAAPLFELIQIEYNLTLGVVLGTYLLDFLLTLIISIPKMRKICSTEYNRSTLRRGTGS